MKRWIAITVLTGLVAACGGEPGQSLSTSAASVVPTEAVTVTPVLTTTATSIPGAITTVSTTTLPSASTEPMNTTTATTIGSEAISTEAPDPALRRDAWIGLVITESRQHLPPGFRIEMSSCIGDPSDADICSHGLMTAHATDDASSREQYLVFLERGGDEPGTWTIVDALYVEFPTGRGLVFHTDCWVDSIPGSHFGVGPRGDCARVHPLRAWGADWQDERIVEVEAPGSCTCQEVCD